MGILDGIGFEFSESMSGFLGVGESDPQRGEKVARRNGTGVRFDVKIEIPDLGPFMNLSERTANLSGTVTFEPLGGKFSIRDGIFNLFSVSGETGTREMAYSFRFTASDGKTYYFHGYKKIYDDPGEIDVVEDMTRLFSVLYRGEDEHGEIYGAGILCFRLEDSPSLVSSMTVKGARNPLQKMAAYTAFSSFAWGAIRNEYLKEQRLFYDTEYQNLVLSGTGQVPDGESRSFFLVSGAHDKGFPWGDCECFWDVLLVVSEPGAKWRRFCITDRILEGMELDVERGSYRYKGPIFELTDGYATSFSAIRQRVDTLRPMQADLQIDFTATSYDMVSFPFPVVPKLLRKLSTQMAKTLNETLPAEHPIGLSMMPHRVVVRSGAFHLTPGADSTGDSVSLSIDADSTSGEAERSTLRGLKEPTLLYSYICGVQPDAEPRVRIQIHARTLQDEREKWAKDKLDALLGSALSGIAAADVQLSGDSVVVRSLVAKDGSEQTPPLFIKHGDPILEVNNDHYPKAVFQRRIIKVTVPSGSECLALEEDMSLMRLEPINSEDEVSVATIRDTDKCRALDRVLDETRFDDTLIRALKASGKDKSQFLVAIKPNFMFSYNKRDRSSYTDPELFAHLVKRVRNQGFQRIALVEAQSSYGEFFDRRSVAEVADYLGYRESDGYTIVDLTLDADEKQHFGPHLGEHPVPRTWRDADFRISFAKNKTHAYATYTLTLKNIYGALPLANKFKEYHCDRDIYYTTVEYLAAFPVHFGLIDAVISADGPFGVFADTRPNQTQTVIGGPSLIATDWVGASKMGIDPLISKYMKLAVEAFGKPRIRLIGDVNPYRPWLNVPPTLTLMTHKGVDADYHFGNLFYLAAAQMDETQFKLKKRGWYVAPLRWLAKPLRKTFFVRTGKNPSKANRFFSRLFYKMGF